MASKESDPASSGAYTNIYGVVSDYAKHFKAKEEMKQKLLNSPGRYQAISEREDRSDTPKETMKGQARGKYFIHHRGCTMMKSANDQVIMKELFALARPATVIELGTFTGGSAVWMSDVLKLEGVDCSVYSMDINPDLIEDRVKEIKPENVTFLKGDCFKIAETFTADFLKSLPHPWIVIDDAHENILQVLEHFAGHMTTGDYLIVEDSNPHMASHVGGGYVNPQYIPAGNVVLDIIREFLTKYEKTFAVDSYFTDFFGYNGTWNWHGYIRRM